MLLGFFGVQAGVAQADVPTPTSSAMPVLPQTDPPGPCTADELGQTKVGPDGELYECVPVGSDPGV